MKPDPIIEEIHRTRQKIAKRFGNDLRAICDDARQRQIASGRKAVRFPPKLSGNGNAARVG
jgi:hypothetical protein